MARNTALLGALLTILGIGTFALLSFAPSKWTALIPAGFGIVFLVLGVLAQRKVEWRRYFIHAATALAVLAILGTAPGLVQTAVLLRGGEVARPAAAVEQGITALLCMAFLVNAIKSFLETRRAPVSERS